MVLKSFTSQLALNVVDLVVRQSYVHDGTASDKLRWDCKKTECFKERSSLYFNSLGQV